jgi:hypothetical protein
MARYRYFVAQTDRPREIRVFGNGTPTTADSDYQSCDQAGYLRRFGYPPFSPVFPAGGYETAWCLYNDENVTQVTEEFPTEPDDGSGGSGTGGNTGGGTGGNTGGGTGGNTGGGTGGTGGGVVGSLPVFDSISKKPNKSTEKQKPAPNTKLEGKIIYSPTKKLLKGGDFDSDFQPFLGQRLTYRETLILRLQMNVPNLLSATLDRVVPRALAGQYQHLRQLDDGSVAIVSEQPINASITVLSEPFAIITRDFYLANTADKGDFFGAVPSQIINCNADLKPALVGNEFLNPLNAPGYAIASAAMQGDADAAVTIEAASLSPALPGWRFPTAKPLLTGLQQIPVVDIDNASYRVQLDQNGIYLYPGWELLSIEHEIEVVEQSSLAKAPNQLETTFTCNF